MTPSDTISAHVAVGIPTWYGGAFIGATVASLLAQTHQDWSAVISIDGDDDDTAAACAPYLTDSRVRLIVQEQRLGWVGNCAAVLAAGDGDYAMILPHDDLLDPRYLAVLLGHAAAHPEAACTYCDISMAGHPPLTQPSVCGLPLVRQMTLLSGHLPAVGFRGLVPRAALAAVGPPRPNDADGYGADTVWLARLARVGDLHRVPATLYEKRYHAHNTHGAWSRWGMERQRRAWIVHCRDMLAEALACTNDPNARWVLVALAVSRLIGVLPVPGAFEWLSTFDEPGRITLAEEFLSTIWSSTGLDVETSLSPLVVAHRLAAPWQSESPTVTRLDAALAEARTTLERALAERAEQAAERGRLSEEVTRLGNHLTAQEIDHQRLADEIARLRTSTSWRITAPLRALADHWRARGG